jgi:hypothetical protein
MTQRKPAVAGDVAHTTPPQAPEGALNPLASPSGAPSSGAPDPILAMIERAARDPAVDLAKLQGLMAMKKDVEAERASIAFAEAFAELQPDLPTIDRRGRIVVFSKSDRDKPGGVPPDAEPIQNTPYATLDDVLEALRKPLADHGFSLRFEHRTEPVGDSYRIITTAILRHRQGHEERASSPPLPHDSTGSKNPVQAVASAMTYGRRYALMAVLPIVSHAPQDADDDGRAAGSALIDADQLVKVQELIAETQSDLTIFFDTLGATGFSDMTVKQYRRGISLLLEKKKRLNAAKKNA